MRAALFLPSANWYCSQLCAWGVPRDGSGSVYFAYGCKSHVAIYEMLLTDENTLGEPRFYADVPRGKHDKRVTSVVFLHGADEELLLACAGEEGSIQLWDVAKREMVDRQRKHKTEIMAIASAEDHTIVAGDRNGVLSVWRRDTGISTLATPIAGDCIYCLHVAGGMVAIGYRSGKVILWDVHQGAITTRLKGHDEEVHAVSWFTAANDKLLLATSSRDKKLCVYDGDNLIMESQLPKPKKAMSAHQLGRLWFTHAWMPCADADAVRLVTSSYNGELYSWEWSLSKKRPKLSVAPTIVKQGHTRPIFNIAALSLSTASTYVVTVSMDRDVRVLHAPSMTSHSKLAGLGGHVYTLQFNASGVLAAGIGDNTIRLVRDVHSPQTTCDLVWKGLQSKVTALAWHPMSPTMLAYGCEDGAVGYYDTASHQHIRFKAYQKGMIHQVAWRAPPTTDGAPVQDWLAALDAVEHGERDVMETTVASHSSSALQLWICAGDGTLTVANPETPDAPMKAVNKRWGVHNVTSFAWQPNAVTCAVGTKDGIVHLVVDDDKAHQYMDHTKAVSCVDWRGSTLVTASYDGSVCVYDFTGERPQGPARVFKGHATGVTCIAWSPSAEFLASASMDGTVQVWPQGDDRGFNFRGHTGRVLTVAWVDDKTLVSAGEDQSIRAWAYTDQTCTLPPKGKEDPAPAPASLVTSKKSVPKQPKAPAAVTGLLPKAVIDVESVAKMLDPPSSVAMIDDAHAQYMATGDWERAARLLVLHGHIGDALRLVAKEGSKLSPVWLAYAPMAGSDVWREFTGLYAKQLRDARAFQDAALHYTSVGDVHAAIECLCDGQLWRDALALVHLRCSPFDPVRTATYEALASHLQATHSAEEAGQVYVHLNQPDQALACFLKAASPSSFDAAARLPLSNSLALDLANRAMVLGFDSAVAILLAALPPESDPTAHLFLAFYLRSKLPPSSVMVSNQVLAHSLLAHRPEGLPPLLTEHLTDGSWFWAALDAPGIALRLRDADEDEVRESIEKTFGVYLQAAPIHGRLLTHLVRIGTDVAQGCLVSAFETWSTTLAWLLSTTEGSELLGAFCLVFPRGVQRSPIDDGELGTESSAAQDLWALFFLYQCIALARVVRLEANTDPLASQEALLFLIQWINNELPVEQLEALGADVTRLTRTASNELSLLYHQLLATPAGDSAVGDDTLSASDHDDPQGSTPDAVDE
ncbi:hypothetical protein SDRG_04178 [Saprolegnia diclina VS20]|uniref:Gem-associated protein 5 TPR domain-containing protein n=1 Tax=Saprolegnia diclina (strain VS20) TaxID=1156394 RepID=T0QWU8_SAPDV|nr:hypothetical protein SDRG_04178 [Saprolegnia diclina VS20]EQC38470.1 hypothetical protein SDRG_04178 [Saprolegnia diclina VS20]|eukprot:XP_008608062.1 hypothetical protein SDRG_04178 [Saprolegnia diclina VS20]